LARGFFSRLLEVAVPLVRPHIVGMVIATDEYLFKCSKIDCPAAYIAIHKDYARDKKPRCSQCDTPFLVMETADMPIIELHGTLDPFVRTTRLMTRLKLSKLAHVELR
jgi:hypothetical protein